MPNLTEKETQSFKNLLAVMSGETLSKKDFTAAFQNVVQFLLNISKRVDTSLAEFKQTADDIKAELKKDTTDDIEELKRVAQQAVTQAINTMLNEHRDRMNKVESNVQDFMSKDDARDEAMFARLAAMIPTAEEIKNMIPSMGISLRDALETLQGPQRLRLSAIHGFDEALQVKMDEGLKNGKLRIVGARSGFLVYINGVKEGMLTNVNFAAGTGMTIGYSKVNGQPTLTFSSAAATTVKYLIAAYNAPDATKAIADYTCDGVADDVQINAAITAAAAAANGGADIDLSEGQFNLAASIAMSSSYINITGRGIGATLVKTQNGSNANPFSLTGTGTIHCSVRRMQIDCNRANNTFGSGIHINTPWQNYDAEHIFEDLLITNCNNNGVEASANADTRAMFFNRVHVKGADGNGFYFPWPSITDSIFVGCIADTIALNGFYQGGANNHHTDCKMFYCGSAGGENMGFQIVGYNNYFTTCEAQDNYQSGFYGNAAYGDPTYANFGCTFINCIADSNNQNGNASYGCGFQGVGVKQWQIIGGIAMTRPYPSFTQRVGISWSGGADANIVDGTFLFSNTTNYKDSASGNNLYNPGASQSDHYSWERDGALNIRKFGAVGDGKRFFAAVATSGSKNVSCAGANFTSADVGKTVLVYKEASYGTITTIASVTNSTNIVLTANAGVTTTSGNGYIVYGTDDSTIIQRVLTYAATFVQPGSLTDPNQPAGSGQVKVLLPGNGTQSMYILTASVTIPVGVILEADGHVANLLSSRNKPCILMQTYTGISKLELENLGGTGINAGTAGNQAAISFGDLKIWHGIGSAAPVGLAATPLTTGGSIADGTYYYKISAFDSAGYETPLSSEVTSVISGGTGHGSTSLSWTAFSGATSYRIYRGNATGLQNIFFTSGTNSYTDTGASFTSAAPVGPGYALLMNGYHYSIDSVYVKECTIGMYHNGASDTSVRHAFMVGCRTGIFLYNSNQVRYNHIFLDTCSSSILGGLVIDNACTDVTIENLQTFNINVVSTTLNPVVNVGPLTTAASTYIRIKYQANNTGGVGLSLANVQDIIVDHMLSNSAFSGQQSNAITTAVAYGSNLAGEVAVRGVYSSGITVSTGTQYGTHSYQQGNAITNL